MSSISERQFSETTVMLPKMASKTFGLIACWTLGAAEGAAWTAEATAASTPAMRLRKRIFLDLGGAEKDGWTGNI